MMMINVLVDSGIVYLQQTLAGPHFVRNNLCYLMVKPAGARF